MKKIMNKPITNQRGLTLLSWVVVIVFLLFQGVIAMNVLPVYMTDRGVKAIMDNLPSDPRAQETPITGLRALIAKRLSMNSIYTVKSDYIKVKKSRGEHVVTIEYEPRGKLIGNLEYIVSFKHEARIKPR